MIKSEGNVWLALAINVERFAILDYKKAISRYERAVKMPNCEKRKRILYQAGRSIEALEQHFAEDMYGVFDGAGELICKEIRKRMKFNRVQEITFEEYKEILQREYIK